MAPATAGSLTSFSAPADAAFRLEPEPFLLGMLILFLGPSVAFGRGEFRRGGRGRDRRDVANSGRASRRPSPKALT
jgi:hypothetical protein